MANDIKSRIHEIVHLVCSIDAVLLNLDRTVSRDARDIVLEQLSGLTDDLTRVVADIHALQT